MLRGERVLPDLLGCDPFSTKASAAQNVGFVVSVTDARSAAPATLDQFIALNDEIAALVRVGVPLEPGLTQVATELPGPTGRLAGWVADCLRRGQSLEQIFADHGNVFPPIYRAVVEAGTRSGRLAAALESVAVSARHVAMTRRMIAASLIYPLVVVLIAWGLLVFYTVLLAGGFLRMAEDFNLPAREALVLFDRWGHSAAYWGPLVPLVALGAFGTWWLVSARASHDESGSASALLGWLPWTRRVLRTSQVATFADLLGMLVEHGVPLSEGIVLAAEATGGRRLAADGRQIAEALQRGEPLAPYLRGLDRFPPLLIWFMSFGQTRDALAPALRQAAEMYRQKANDQAEVARVFVPVVLTVVFGGSVTLLYALMVLGSWFSMVRALAN